MGSETPISEEGASSDRSKGASDTVARLRRWANARDKRLAAGGHAGATGTALLREAADEIEQMWQAFDDRREDAEMPDDLPDEDFHIVSGADRG